MWRWRLKGSLRTWKQSYLSSFGMVVLLMMLGLVVLQIRFIIFLSRNNKKMNSLTNVLLFILCRINIWTVLFMSWSVLFQVAQVLLTLPYSFSQLGMLSGILFQLFYGLLGSWTAYIISILYVEYRTRREREKVDFRNHVIQVFTLHIKTKFSLTVILVDPCLNMGLICFFYYFNQIVVWSSWWTPWKTLEERGFGI